MAGNPNFSDLGSIFLTTSQLQMKETNKGDLNISELLGKQACAPT
jgi:hypothetical protein